MTYQIAETIRTQLSNGTLAMLGAKNLLADERSLQFKIGRNPTRATHIRIELDPSDTYTITVSRVSRKYDVTTLAELSGVYVDSMHEVIEAETGLLTRL